MSWKGLRLLSFLDLVRGSAFSQLPAGVPIMLAAFNKASSPHKKQTKATLLHSPWAEPATLHLRLCCEGNLQNVDTFSLQ